MFETNFFTISRFTPSKAIASAVGCDSMSRINASKSAGSMRMFAMCRAIARATLPDATLKALNTRNPDDDVGFKLVDLQVPPASLSNIVVRYGLATYRAGCWTLIAT